MNPHVADRTIGLQVVATNQSSAALRLIGFDKVQPPIVWRDLPRSLRISWLERRYGTMLIPDGLARESRYSSASDGTHSVSANSCAFIQYKFARMNVHGFV